MNLPQSLVIMLDMLYFLILFMQLYKMICSHPRPLQHTSPQCKGLDVQLTNTPQLQTRSSTLTKKLCSCAVPFVFSSHAPYQASFRSLPLGFKYIIPYIYICMYMHTYCTNELMLYQKCTVSPSVVSIRFPSCSFWALHRDIP